MLYYCLSDNKDHLKLILELSKNNLKKQLSNEEVESEGFITVQYTEAEIQLMANLQKQVVAIDQKTEKVAGYALLLDRSLEKNISYLVSMFETINDLSYKGNLLGDEKYIVMGQVCVGKQYRGRGVFRRMYETFVDHTRETFDYIITEVHAENARSLRAHYRFGFEALHQYKTEDGNTWVIVIYQIDNH